MAKIQFSAVGITDMRNKLNGQVFSRNRGGAFVRTKVTPNNPRTVAQLAVRAIFASISQGWSGLSEEERNSWNNAVENWKRTDVFGNLRTPSGKALYQRLNNELQISGQTQLTVAPELVEIPVIEDFGATYESPSGLNVSYTSDLTGFKLEVFATAPLTPGTSNANNKFRLIDVVDGGEGIGATVGASYVAKFGSVPANANIQVRMKLVAPNGQTSTIYQAKATAV